MKFNVLLLFCLLTTSLSAQSSKPGDEILGVWLTGSGKGKVEIFKKGEHFHGKIVWLKEPIDPATNKPKMDIKHPNKSMHSRQILGIQNLWGFVFKGDNTWEGGHIYDPNNGKEYKCVITLKDRNNIDVRGYVGITLIGRTDSWTRSKL
ncbi:MAG: DUF2147 domain-containing protein [bacterium]|jgi:uncharacterized protein (DUF2147 family)